jgi:diacylglycerol kinase family enzyme
VYQTPDGVTRNRYFLVSASPGLVAAANNRFNEGHGFLGPLKRYWTTGAIFAAALHTLARARPLDLHLDGVPARVMNLSVQKSRFVAGTLTYDTPVAPDDGRFAVNLAGDLTRIASVRAFGGLLRGRFAGRRGCRAWHASALTVDGAVPMLLELDGEVVQAVGARFEVLPRRICVCSA